MFSRRPTCQVGCVLCTDSECDECAHVAQKSGANRRLKLIYRSRRDFVTWYRHALLNAPGNIWLLSNGQMAWICRFPAKFAVSRESGRETHNFESMRVLSFTRRATNGLLLVAANGAPRTNCSIMLCEWRQRSLAHYTGLPGR